MTQPIQPALTPTEWMAIAENSEYLLPSIVGDLRILDSDDLARAIAYANAKLPDDSPYKITREDVRTLRAEARYVGSGGLESEYEDEPYLTQGKREQRLRDVAAKLDALLPPETG